MFRHRQPETFARGMGLFDRLIGKKEKDASVAAPEAPSSANESLNEATPAPAAVNVGGAATLPRLAAARDCLVAKDLAGAVAIYESLLAESGDRADVLVRISGDLGANGHVQEIAELVAPRYDAERHGPATGLNVLQAYLALQNPDAAQQVLDLLFALKRPELEERLHGFANAIAELVEAQRRGALPAPGMVGPGGAQRVAPRVAKINLITISKPIWFYGLEAIAEEILPPKEKRLRRVAFAPLGVLGLTDAGAAAKDPTHELARLSRAIPLWLAEVLYFSPAYAPLAVVGLQEQPTAEENHLAIFPFEWSQDQIRQLVASSGGEGLDYVFTGAIGQTENEYELTLRLWEVKKLRDRKQFTVQWTPATATSVLTQLGENLRQFMEANPYPEGCGIRYATPAALRDWLDAQDAAVGYFLAEKKLLPTGRLMAAEVALRSLAPLAAEDPLATLAWLTLRARMSRMGAAPNVEATLLSSPLVEKATAALA